MRILEIDAGREMRGGQWQVLRLMEGLRTAGVEASGRCSGWWRAWPRRAPT